MIHVYVTITNGSNKTVPLLVYLSHVVQVQVFCSSDMHSLFNNLAKIAVQVIKAQVFMIIMPTCKFPRKRNLKNENKFVACYMVEQECMMTYFYYSSPHNKIMSSCGLEVDHSVPHLLSRGGCISYIRGTVSEIQCL